jgi:GAF domain-containing protein
VITEKDLDVAQQIAQRLAIALENKRLFEQSRSQAFRERKAGEIAGLLIGATDVESVLSLAADSFNEALGAVSTRIHLQPDVLEEPKSSRRGGILA